MNISIADQRYTVHTYSSRVQSIYVPISLSTNYTPTPTYPLNLSQDRSNTNNLPDSFANNAELSLLSDSLSFPLYASSNSFIVDNNDKTAINNSLEKAKQASQHPTYTTNNHINSSSHSVSLPPPPSAPRVAPLPTSPPTYSNKSNGLIQSNKGDTNVYLPGPHAAVRFRGYLYTLIPLSKADSEPLPPASLHMYTSQFKLEDVPFFINTHTTAQSKTPSNFSQTTSPTKPLPRIPRRSAPTSDNSLIAPLSNHTIDPDKGPSAFFNGDHHLPYNPLVTPLTVSANNTEATSTTDSPNYKNSYREKYVEAGQRSRYKSGDDCYNSPASSDSSFSKTLPSKKSEGKTYNLQRAESGHNNIYNKFSKTKKETLNEDNNVASNFSPNEIPFKRIQDVSLHLLVSITSSLKELLSLQSGIGPLPRLLNIHSWEIRVYIQPPRKSSPSPTCHVSIFIVTDYTSLLSIHQLKNKVENTGDSIYPLNENLEIEFLQLIKELIIALHAADEAYKVLAKISPFPRYKTPILASLLTIDSLFSDGKSGYKLNLCSIFSLLCLSPQNLLTCLLTFYRQESNRLFWPPNIQRLAQTLPSIPEDSLNNSYTVMYKSWESWTIGFLALSLIFGKSPNIMKKLLKNIYDLNNTQEISTTFHPSYTYLFYIIERLLTADTDLFTIYQLSYASIQCTISQSLKSDMRLNKETWLDEMINNCKKEKANREMITHKLDSLFVSSYNNWKSTINSIIQYSWLQPKEMDWLYFITQRQSETSLASLKSLLFLHSLALKGSIQWVMCSNVAIFDRITVTLKEAKFAPIQSIISGPENLDILLSYTAWLKKKYFFMYKYDKFFQGNWNISPFLNNTNFNLKKACYINDLHHSPIHVTLVTLLCKLLGELIKISRDVLILLYYGDNKEDSFMLYWADMLTDELWGLLTVLIHFLDCFIRCYVFPNFHFDSITAITYSPYHCFTLCSPSSLTTNKSSTKITTNNLTILTCLSQLKPNFSTTISSFIEYCELASQMLDDFSFLKRLVCPPACLTYLLDNVEDILEQEAKSETSQETHSMASPSYLTQDAIKFIAQLPLPSCMYSIDLFKSSPLNKSIHYQHNQIWGEFLSIDQSIHAPLLSIPPSTEPSQPTNTSAQMPTIEINNSPLQTSLNTSNSTIATPSPHPSITSTTSPSSPNSLVGLEKQISPSSSFHHTSPSKQISSPHLQHASPTSSGSQDNQSQHSLKDLPQNCGKPIETLSKTSHLNTDHTLPLSQQDASLPHKSTPYASTPPSPSHSTASVDRLSSAPNDSTVPNSHTGPSIQNSGETTSSVSPTRHIEYSENTNAPHNANTSVEFDPFLRSAEASSPSDELTIVTDPFYILPEDTNSHVFTYNAVQNRNTTLGPKTSFPHIPHRARFTEGTTSNVSNITNPITKLFNVPHKPNFGPMNNVAFVDERFQPPLYNGGAQKPIVYYDNNVPPIPPNQNNYVLNPNKMVINLPNYNNAIPIQGQQGLNNPGPIPAPPHRLNPFNIPGPNPVYAPPHTPLMPMHISPPKGLFINAFGPSIPDTSQSQSLNDWEVNPSEVVLKEKIGSGVTSEVFRGIWRGTEVAVKVLYSSDFINQLNSDFYRELMIMLRLRHPNLVLFMGAYFRQVPYTFVTEYCSGGTLFELLHNTSLQSNKKKNNYTQNQLTWKQKHKLSLDLARGCTYLHSSIPRIIHRDLKSLNILLAAPITSPHDVPLAKVADFGLSCIKGPQSTRYASNPIGTFQWMAPEILLGSEYDEKVDVYSYGIVLYEIITSKIPYEEMGTNFTNSPAQIGLAVSQGKRPEMSFVPSDCPRRMTKLMKSCLAHLPSKRPSFSDIITTLTQIDFDDNS